MTHPIEMSPRSSILQSRPPVSQIVRPEGQSNISEEERMEIINGIPMKVRIIRRSPEKHSPNKVVIPQTQTIQQSSEPQNQGPPSLPPNFLQAYPVQNAPSSSELESLKAKIRDLEEKLKGSQQELSQKEKGRADVLKLNKIYDQQTNEIDELRRQVALLTSKLSNRDEMRSRAADDLEREAESMRSDIRKLRQQVIDLTHRHREELHLAEIRHREEAQRVSELEKQLAFRDADLKELESRAFQKELDIKALQRQATDEIQKQLELTNRIVQLEESEKAAKKKATEAEDKYFEQESEVNRLQNKIKELSNRIKAYEDSKASHREAQDKQQRLQEELSRLKKSHESELADFKQELNEIKEKLKKCQKELQEAKSKNTTTELQEEIDNLKRKEKKLVRDLESERKINEQKENDLNELRLKLRNAKKDLADMKNQPTLPTENIEALKLRIEDYEKNESELIQELVALKSALRASQMANINQSNTSPRVPRYILDELQSLRYQLRSLQVEHQDTIEEVDASQSTMRAYIQSLKSMFDDQVECYPVGTVASLLRKLKRLEQDSGRPAGQDRPMAHNRLVTSQLTPDNKPQVIDTYYDQSTGQSFCSSCMNKSMAKKTARFDDDADNGRLMAREIDRLEEIIEKKDHDIERLRQSQFNQSPKK